VLEENLPEKKEMKARTALYNYKTTFILMSLTALYNSIYKIFSLIPIIQEVN